MTSALPPFPLKSRIIPHPPHHDSLFWQAAPLNSPAPPFFHGGAETSYASGVQEFHHTPPAHIDSYPPPSVPAFSRVPASLICGTNFSGDLQPFTTAPPPRHPPLVSPSPLQSLTHPNLPNFPFSSDRVLQNLLRLLPWISEIATDPRFTSGMTSAPPRHTPAVTKPPWASSLHNQSAALISVGLLYEGSAHPQTMQILLSEIGCKSGGDNVLEREGYAVSAGFSLGLVALGRGQDVIGSIDTLVDRLFQYIGGKEIHNRLQSSCL